MDHGHKDTVTHQDAHEDLIDDVIEAGVGKTGAAIATPASPGASYVQAEVVALRTAIASILAVLRTNGIIAP